MKTPGPIRYDLCCTFDPWFSSFYTLTPPKNNLKNPHIPKSDDHFCFGVPVCTHIATHFPTLLQRASLNKKKKFTLYFLSPLFLLLGSITPGFSFSFLSLPSSSILFLPVEGKPVSLPLCSFQHASVFVRECRKYVLMLTYLSCWYLTVSVSCVLVHRL